MQLFKMMDDGLVVGINQGPKGGGSLQWYMEHCIHLKEMPSMSLMADEQGVAPNSKTKTIRMYPARPGWKRNGILCTESTCDERNTLRNCCWETVHLFG